MRKPDTVLKSILLTASVVLLASSTWAVKSWQQLTATAINGVAFFDCNSNGIRDNSEAPFASLNVRLTGTTATGSALALITATDDRGNYSFVGVEAGTYVVKFSLPTRSTALSFTTKSAVANGSDVNALGTTDSLSVDGIMDVQGVDAGIIDRTAPIVTFTNPDLAPYAEGDTITVSCDNLPTMDATWASAMDNTGKPVKVEFIDLAISTNQCATRGYLTLLHCIFRARDTCGNVGEKAVFVKIIDTKAPVLSGVPSDITVNTLNGASVPANSGVSATDNCAANPVPITFAETEAANTCGKTITRTWSASDDCGNIARRFQIITVISNATCSGGNGGSMDTLRLVLTQGVTIDTCLNLAVGSMLSNIQHCSAGQPSATVTLTASNCLRITASLNFVGLDTFCARVCDVNGQNCRDMRLIFRVNAARLGVCDILSDRGNINLMPRTCGENACYCIVGTTDIRTLTTNYTITDNGQIYNGGLSGCQFDTIYSYNYFAVPNMGASGPYRLDYWRVNGTTRQIASFQTIQQLTDSMNIWDPMGNWRIDDTRFLMYGGDNRSQYGQMKITSLSNLAFGTLELNTGLISNGVKLCFTRGLHTVIFQNNATGCADTLRANVFCAQDRRAPIAVDDRISTTKNTTVRISATLNDTLNGVFESLNVLTRPLHGVLTQNMETFWYTPNTDYCGRDSVDYRICNAFGLCDTGRIFVETTCRNDTTGGNARRRPVAVDDVANTRLNRATTFSVLANDTLNGVLTRPLSISRFPMRGSVNITTNQITYTPTSGFCNGRDTFDYEICNINGCDTGRVVVNVSCEGDTTGGGTRRPIAVDDNASTQLNRSVTISVLANDTINGTLTRPLSIVRFQAHGTVNVMNNQFMYTPTAGFCNARDSFDYEICNANGCDTGRVIVTVMCESDSIGGSRRPVAFDDAVMTRLNTPLMISILANDSLNGTLNGSVNIVRFQMHGTVNSLNNRILYTPDLGFCGSLDTFDYVICNANGCDTGRVFVTVTCENDGSGRPVAVDDRVTTRLDSRVTIPVLDNDRLNGFLNRAINIIKPPRRGMSVISNNQILYMPNAMFCGGNDTLDYEICNAIGCDTASVIVSITCNNDTTGGGVQKPVAINDRVLARINASLTISPLANDTLNGVLARPLSMIGTPLHGQAVLMSNQILYIPNTDYCGGNDTLTYEICNTHGCDTAQIIVEVSCDNGRPKPIAVDDVATTRRNTPVTVAVLTNDTLNGVLSPPLSIVRTQTRGVANVVNNQIIYTPSAGFCNGMDTLTYRICNANGCDTGRLIITVTCDTTTNNGGGGSSRAIVAVNDHVSTTKNTPLTFRPTANDTVRTKLLSLMITAEPRNGAIAFRGVDTLLYTPNRDFCGRDTIKYTICDTSFVCSDAVIYINVTCGDTTNNGGNNRKPNAFNDFATTKKGSPVTIAVLTNDSTYGTLTRPVTVISAPRNGTTAIQNNQVVYTPNPLFCGGRDTLTYEICNTNGCDTALIYVAVTCDTTVNNGGSNRPVVAVNDNISTRKNVQITFNPTVNDTIRTRLLALMIINAPRNGSVGFQGLDTISYTPNRDFCGRDTFEYTICDTSFNCASAFVFVNITCDSVSILSPIAVPDYATTRKNTPIRINILANDTQNGVLDSIKIVSLPRRGTAAIGADNVLTYSTDTCGFTDTLVYRICNRNGCDTALVAIKVSCDTIITPRVLPIAINDTARTKSGQPVTINVLQNDTLNGILVGRVGITKRPRFGTALINGNNEVIYTPENGFCGGRDTLNYEICTANGCDTALVSINVVCDSLMATLPPVAVFDEAMTRKNTPIRISILANDTLNGTLDSIKIIRSPLLGMASLDGNNILTYTPDSCGFTDSLIYRICNRNGCDTAIVRIKVTCDTVMTNFLAPVAVFDTVRTPKGQVVTIRVTLNDTLRGADTFRITRNPIHGIAMFDIDRHIAYKSDSLYCGSDTLIYEICNNRGCDTALVIIKVTCDTLPPVIRPDAVDDFVKTIINRRVDFVILGNDILRGARFAEMVSPPAHGTIIIMPDSMAMYKPDKEFCGKDSFRYRICNAVGCDTAMVRVDVNCGDTLQVFSGFSPNNDGKNDLLVIRGIENHPDNEVTLFNRWGNQIFSKKGYRNESGWDGTWGDKHVPNGTYFYIIRLNNPKNQQFTGYIQLMR